MATATTESAVQPRRQDVDDILVGAVDLHCHSGPAAMPRILDHYEAFKDAADARFRALVYKDHYYPGMAHAQILEKLYPDYGVRLFSGVALNNATGGVNRYAVDHAAKLGGKIVWMPTFSAANHIEKYRKKDKAALSFPSTREKMVDPTPLTVLDDGGRLTDETKAVLDIIAESNMILSGGHLHVSELHPLFEEAKRRGVAKMMINHPTYLIDCTDEDMRGFVSMGVYLEHSICMFIDNSRVKMFEPEDLRHLIEVGTVDRTILGSDLGLQGAPRPLEGYRQIVAMLLDLQFTPQEIKKLVSTNPGQMLDLEP